MDGAKTYTEFPSDAVTIDLTRHNWNSMGLSKLSEGQGYVYHFGDFCLTVIQGVSKRARDETGMTAWLVRRMKDENNPTGRFGARGHGVGDVTVVATAKTGVFVVY